MHSSIIHQVGLNQSGESSVLSIILQSGFFCNSDKYSFCFTIAQLPQGQRDMMLSQMTPQDQATLWKKRTVPAWNNLLNGLMLSVTSTFTIYTVSSNLANADLSFIISSRRDCIAPQSGTERTVECSRIISSGCRLPLQQRASGRSFGALPDINRPETGQCGHFPKDRFLPAKGETLSGSCGRLSESWYAGSPITCGHFATWLLVTARWRISMQLWNTIIA